MDSEMYKDYKIRQLYDLILSNIEKYEFVFTSSASIVVIVLSFLKDRMRDMFPDVLSNY